jgi:hypothetical protein
MLPCATATGDICSCLNVRQHAHQTRGQTHCIATTVVLRVCTQQNSKTPVPSAQNVQGYPCLASPQQLIAHRQKTCRVFPCKAGCTKTKPPPIRTAHDSLLCTHKRGQTSDHNPSSTTTPTTTSVSWQTEAVHASTQRHLVACSASHIGAPSLPVLRY